MAGKNPSSSSKPQPERANIVTPLVQNSVMIHELDQVQPVGARLEDKVKLSRFVIQPRVEHGVAINIPEAQQLRRVEPPPIPVSVEQARVIGVAVDRVRVAQNVGRIVGQIVRNPPPVVPTQMAVVVNPAPQQVQPAPVAQPPLVIAPAAANVRPTKYLYVPGLAQDQYVQNPCATIDAFCNRVSRAFGFRVRKVLGGKDSVNRCLPDDFRKGSVETLCNQKGVTPINCGHAFRWVMITSQEMEVYTSKSSGMRYLDADRKMYTSKAFKVLGAPQDNYMALTAGTRTAPKELAYDRGEDPHCIGSEYSAQRKPAEPADQNRPARIELLPLEHLRDDDILYIVGHGNQRGGTLTYKVPVPGFHRVQDASVAQRQPAVCTVPDKHFEKWYVDPTALAALLRDEGLPKTHKCIEMWMCYGAGMNLAGEQTVQSYCQRLAGALGGFGYKRIQVGGVLGLTYPDLSINPTLRPFNPLIDGREKAGQLIISAGDENKVKPNTPAHAKLHHTFGAK